MFSLADSLDSNKVSCFSDKPFLEMAKYDIALNTMSGLVLLEWSLFKLIIPILLNRYINKDNYELHIRTWGPTGAWVYKFDRGNLKWKQRRSYSSNGRS